MENKFLAIIKEALEIDDRDIQLEDNFRDYEEWNSLAVLSMISALDDEYDLVLSSEELRKLNTLDDLYKEVSSRI